MSKINLKEKKIAALLPFKKNSERVPQKNFKLLGDKELYKWILEKLIKMEEIDEVIINTDARKEIENDSIFRSKKINIRDRNTSICGDYISMNEIIKDDLMNSEFEFYVMTHTTNPFLSISTIKKALNKFFIEIENSHHDSLFTVNKIQTRFYKKNGIPFNHNPEILIRTQDLEPLYEENSNLYIFSKKSFLRSNSRIGKNPILYETDKYESIDIDDLQDWEIASLIAKNING